MACVPAEAKVGGFAMMTSTDALFRMLLGIAAGSLGAIAEINSLLYLVAFMNLLLAGFILIVWETNKKNEGEPKRLNGSGIEVT